MKIIGPWHISEIYHIPGGFALTLCVEIGRLCGKYTLTVAWLRWCWHVHYKPMTSDL